MSLHARIPVAEIVIDYSVTPINSTTWTQILASLPDDVNLLEIFDSSGALNQLGYGPAGHEQNLILIMPGGNTNQIRALLNAGMRIVAKSVNPTGTISSGILAINLYK